MYNNKFMQTYLTYYYIPPLKISYKIKYLHTQHYYYSTKKKNITTLGWKKNNKIIILKIEFLNKLRKNTHTHK